MELLQVVDLSNWKKKQNILEELAAKGFPTEESVLRKVYIKNNNDAYCEHLTDTYIIHHSGKGYKATKSLFEIIKYSHDDRKRIRTLVDKDRKLMQAVRENMNMRLKI